MSGMNNDEQIQISSLSTIDLPSSILVEIFLKLATRSIVMCKSVCKTWRNLIANREFVKTHFGRAKECKLIREIYHSRISRSFYLFEEDDHRSGYCSVQTCLKTPLRNAQDMLSISEDNSEAVFGDALTSSKIVAENRNEVANSCNGFLCLYQTGSCSEQGVNDPLLICNPITGEFTYLPTSCNARSESWLYLQTIAFGFSAESNEYKVIRVFKKRSFFLRPGMNYFLRPSCVVVAEIHTIGTESWRKLESFPVGLGTLSPPAYLDGELHWISHKSDENSSMISFELSEERFRVHSMPFKLRQGLAFHVQGGRLYLHDVAPDSRLDIWVMDDNGYPKSWTRLFSVDFSQVRRFQGQDEYNLVYIRLVCSINKEMVVMFDAGGEFIYYDESKGLRFKKLEFRGRRSYFDAIAYTPSFVSLGDVVGPGSVEILNINGGCGKIKLEEETCSLLLGRPRSDS